MKSQIRFIRRAERSCAARSESRGVRLAILHPSRGDRSAEALLVPLAAAVESNDVVVHFWAKKFIWLGLSESLARWMQGVRAQPRVFKSGLGKKSLLVLCTYPKPWRASSRLYQNRFFLQQNIHFAACFKL